MRIGSIRFWRSASVCRLACALFSLTAILFFWLAFFGQKINDPDPYFLGGVAAFLAVTFAFFALRATTGK
jgi:hypothetical protein